MELQLLELAIRVLDPRKWRVRLLQLAGTLAATAWIAGRAVDQVEVTRAVRDAKHAARNARIRELNQQLEQRRLAP